MFASNLLTLLFSAGNPTPVSASESRPTTGVENPQFQLLIDRVLQQGINPTPANNRSTLPPTIFISFEPSGKIQANQNPVVKELPQSVKFSLKTGVLSESTRLHDNQNTPIFQLTQPLAIPLEGSQNALSVKRFQLVASPVEEQEPVAYLVLEGTLVPARPMNAAPVENDNFEAENILNPATLPGQGNSSNRFEPVVVAVPIQLAQGEASQINWTRGTPVTNSPSPFPFRVEVGDGEWLPVTSEGAGKARRPDVGWASLVTRETPPQQGDVKGEVIAPAGIAKSVAVPSDVPVNTVLGNAVEGQRHSLQNTPQPTGRLQAVTVATAAPAVMPENVRIQTRQPLSTNAEAPQPGISKNPKMASPVSPLPVKQMVPQPRHVASLAMVQEIPAGDATAKLVEGNGAVQLKGNPFPPVEPAQSIGVFESSSFRALWDNPLQETPIGGQRMATSGGGETQGAASTPLAEQGVFTATSSESTTEAMLKHLVGVQLGKKPGKAPGVSGNAEPAADGMPAGVTSVRSEQAGQKSIATSIQWTTQGRESLKQLVALALQSLSGESPMTQPEKTEGKATFPVDGDVVEGFTKPPVNSGNRMNRGGNTIPGFTGGNVPAEGPGTMPYTMKPGELSGNLPQLLGLRRENLLEAAGNASLGPHPEGAVEESLATVAPKVKKQDKPFSETLLQPQTSSEGIPAQLDGAGKAATIPGNELLGGRRFQGPAPVGNAMAAGQQATQMPMAQRLEELVEVIGKWMERMRFHQQPARQTIHIQLQPESLGMVRMMLSMKDNKLQAHIETQRPEAAALIQQHSQQLITRLQEINVQVQQFDVQTHSDMNAFQAHADGRQQSFTGGQSYRATSGDEFTPEAAGRRPRWVGYNTIDLFA